MTLDEVDQLQEVRTTVFGTYNLAEALIQQVQAKRKKKMILIDIKRNVKKNRYLCM